MENKEDNWKFIHYSEQNACICRRIYFLENKNTPALSENKAEVFFTAGGKRKTR